MVNMDDFTNSFVVNNIFNETVKKRVIITKYLELGVIIKKYF